MYKYLEFNNYVPLRKCGAAAGIGAIIGGVGAVASGIGSVVSADDAVDTNIEENEKNRKFNAEEAQKQRDWASDEWQKQFDLQSQQWYEQQDYANQQSYDYWMQQQQYMSPVEQNRRLLAAGLNPAHVVGNSVYGSTGLSAAPVSVPNPSVPSGSSASVSTSNPVAAVDKASAFERAASGLTKIVDAIGSFSKNTAEADSTRAQLQPILDNWLLKNTNQELLNSYQEMYNVFFDNKAPKELKLLGEKINNVIADTIVKQASGELIEEETITEQFKQILTDKDIRLRGEQYLQAVAITANIEKQLKLQNNVLREQAKTEQSKQAENYANSFKLRAEGTTENQLRPLREKSLELSNDIARANRRGLDLDNWLKDETLRAKAKIVIEEARRANLITQEEVYKLGKQIDDYNHRDIDRFFNWLGQGAGAFRDFGVGSSSIGTGVTKSTPVDSPWTIYGGSTPTW